MDPIEYETDRVKASGDEICALCGEAIAYGETQVETANRYHGPRFYHEWCWIED